MKKPITCYLVDDDDDDQEIFRLAVQDLSDYEVAVITEYDGYLALQHLKENPSFIPDYIFLDLNMPRVDGKQCLTEIRKQARYDAVPVIIYSTSSQQHHKEEVKNLGANDFITKPADIALLKSMLLKIFSIPN